MASIGPLLLLFSCSLAAGRPAPGSLPLVGADAMQIATAQLEGTTGGSTTSTATLQVSEDGSVDVEGTASAVAAGSGFTEAAVKSNGHVRQEDSVTPFVANAAVGLSQAVGADVATAAEAWGSSGAGPGPRADAGHRVFADGELTGSAGDQAVAELPQLP